MSIKITLRRAEIKDAGIIAPLFDAYRQFYGQKPAPRSCRRFILQRLTRKESVIFVALGGREALGFTQLYPTFSSVALKRLWILNDLYVAPQRRRMGIAGKLMARARELAIATKAEGLFLETAAGNKAARSLYEKLGWTREKKFYRYNHDL